MKPRFEYSDTLNFPYEAFIFSAENYDYFPVALHWHYFMEILYMIEGCARVHVDNEETILSPGDLMVFHSQAPHSIDAAGPFPLRYYVLKFDPVHLNIASSSLPRLSHILWMVKNTPDMPCHFQKTELEDIPFSDLFQKAITVVERKQFGYDIQAHSLYCLIISELLTLWQKRGFRISENRTLESPNEIFTSVTEYIDRHYAEELRVENLAARFGMSYSNFAAKFRDYYGMSCNTYIQRVRINKAEDLLMQTDYDLSYISQETGFCDSSHLIRVFQNLRHMTPRQFRLSTQNNIDNKN